MTEMTVGEKLRAMLDEGRKNNTVEMPHNTAMYLRAHVGNYMIWDVDPDTLGITFMGTGEMGLFKKKDFEPYIAAFFGLNF
jgi:hypothetical protein